MKRLIQAGRAPISVAFLLIAGTMLFLSWRTYQLADRTERGLESFTIEYLHSAAEIAARRMDAEALAELTQAAESWRNMERDFGTPSLEDLEAWMAQYPWMLSAIWMKDDDTPLNSLYVGGENEGTAESVNLGEFYTSGSAMSYSYDPELLLQSVQGPILFDPGDRHLGGSVDTRRIRAASEIRLITLGSEEELESSDPGAYSVTVPLSPPLDSRAVEASIDSAYLGYGIQSPRINSIFLAVLGLGLLAFAGYLLNRSIRDMSDALQLREALVANVSHELRTPLSMIRLGIETLDREEKLDASERSEIRDAIRRETMLLSHLVENVLDVTRLDSHGVNIVREEVDPADLVYSLLSDYSEWIRRQEFELEISIDETVEPQMWDREAMSRALLNLVENAIKYSRDDRRLTVGLSNRPEEVCLSVRDHGVGLRKEEIGRIFDPYYRAEFSDTVSRRGAGLGLTLVREIVRAHGGRMEVSSAPGEGSTFSMILPRTDELGNEELTAERLRTGKLGLEAERI